MQILEKGQYSGAVESSSYDNGLLITITNYSNETFNSAVHYHENTHLSFVLNGASVEKKKSSYDRVPGKIVFYGAGEVHQVSNVFQSSRHINLEIENSFFQRYGITEGSVDSVIAKTPDVKFLMLKLYNEFIKQDSLSSVSIEMLLLNLLSRAGKKVNEPLPHWVKKVREILNDRWNERVTLSHLSQEAFVHPVTISRYFPHYFSCTLGEYMRKLKVEHALQLIKTSRKTLTEIAYICGFADQSHFIRTFKEFTGMLPDAYRQS